ncbi:DUF6216 family protein [Serratia rubidaea]|uniref:DUF6216 family protein n=1 Tax=Serratia rubidaea TaxID=61652 RepID=UPI0022B8B23C|nr:DUF6216 family protein [Serratia rubidaea]WBF43349.1 DUF6216 family protein [Serratia rubidaea]
MDKIVSWVVDYETWVRLLVFIALLLIVAFYFYLRAGSSYSLLHRTWSLLVGRKKFSTPELNEFMTERLDVDKFNAIFNTQVTSVNQAVNFKNWLKKYNINIRLISRIKGWFDFEHQRVILPNGWMTLAYAILAIASILLAMKCIIIGSSSSALIKVKNQPDEPWFWINSQKAHNYTKYYGLFYNEERDSWQLTAAQCAAPQVDYEKIVPNSGLSTESIKIICGLLNAKDSKNHVGKIVKEQKAFIYMFIILLLILAGLILSIHRRMQAIDTNVKIAKKIKEYHELMRNL